MAAPQSPAPQKAPEVMAAGGAFDWSKLFTILLTIIDALRPKAEAAKAAQTAGHHHDPAASSACCVVDCAQALMTALQCHRECTGA